MDLDQFLNYLVKEIANKGQISHIQHINQKPAHYGQLEKPLPEELEKVLLKKGLWPFFSHQAEAVNQVRKGRNVMLSTPSSSGKSLTYNIPVIESLSFDSSCKALYLFPTKALSRDQLNSLVKLTGNGPDKFRADIYDGDTPYETRNSIRQKANILITNPDMLHVSILPNHNRWSHFLSKLKYIVLDEAHIYRGVFGSNVSLVMRRLRRICHLYGSRPVFILCSATISNPEEHASNLTGLDFHVISEDGAPAGTRDFIFWNPPIVDPENGTRRSSNSEASNLLAELVSNNISSLAFTRTRRLAELIFTYTRDRLKQISPAHQSLIKPYRAGYMPEVRRQIEQELSSGKLKGVVATSALELGIDIGTLDATILTGYPGTISSTWQQAGRSGRSGRKALSIMIGRDDPLDQYLMRNPEIFFNKGFESALINPENPHILVNHILCAAWECPLKDTDQNLFGESFIECVKTLGQEGILKHRGERWFAAASLDYPAKEVDIRSACSGNISIIDTSNGLLIDTMERSAALSQAHPGAIYLNQGESYLIRELDLAGHLALAEPVDVPYYTVADDLTNLSIVREIKHRFLNQVQVCLGEVEVTTSIVSFKRKEQYSEKILGREPLDLPDENFTTIALWFGLPEGLPQELAKEGLDLSGGLHAGEHAAISILPLFAMCDRFDIGGVSSSLHPDTGNPQIFIYDGYPGGIGITEKGFEIITRLWEATYKLISQCTCQEGCPGCIQSPKCGSNNHPLDKLAAIRIFKRLLY